MVCHLPAVKGQSLRNDIGEAKRFGRLGQPFFRTLHTHAEAAQQITPFRVNLPFKRHCQLQNIFSLFQRRKQYRPNIPVHIPSGSLSRHCVSVPADFCFLQIFQGQMDIVPFNITVNAEPERKRMFRGFIGDQPWLKPSMPVQLSPAQMIQTQDLLLRLPGFVIQAVLRRIQ